MAKYNSKLNELDFILKRIFTDVNVTSTNIKKKMVYKFECVGEFELDNIKANVPFTFHVNHKNLNNDIFAINYQVNPKEELNENTKHIAYNVSLNNVNETISNIIETKKMDEEIIKECIYNALQKYESLPLNQTVENDTIKDILETKCKISNVSICKNYEFENSKYTAYILESKLDYARQINTEIVLKQNNIDYLLIHKDKTIIITK
jgi:hypothetical protein